MVSELAANIKQFWGTVSYTEIVVLALVFSFVWLYYSSIWLGFYTGPHVHLPRVKYPLYWYFYKFYLRIYGDVSAYSKIHDEHGKVILFAKNGVMISDLNAFKMLNSYQLKKSVIREREYHSKRKRLLSPAFSVRQMGLMEPLVLETGTLNLVEHLDSQFNGEIKNIRVNIYELFYRSTLDVISQLVFGESLHCIENPEEFKYYMSVISRIQLFLGLVIPFPFLRKFERPSKPFERIVEENMRKRRENKSSHSDIL
ncbi:cytochrome P450, partial [Conidiobolus coronatus NRRL 28638]